LFLPTCHLYPSLRPLSSTKMFEKKPAQFNPGIIKSGYSWLETIVFFDDKLLEKYGDWSMGLYHCKSCGEYQGFCFKVPPKPQPFCPACNHNYGDGFHCSNPEHESGKYLVAPEGEVSKEAHNSRNAFWRKHAHGDGRIVLFERNLV